MKYIYSPALRRRDEGPPPHKPVRLIRWLCSHQCVDTIWVPCQTWNRWKYILGLGIPEKYSRAHLLNLISCHRMDNVILYNRTLVSFFLPFHNFSPFLYATFFYKSFPYTRASSIPNVNNELSGIRNYQGITLGFLFWGIPFYSCHFLQNLIFHCCSWQFCS